MVSALLVGLKIICINMVTLIPMDILQSAVWIV